LISAVVLEGSFGKLLDGVCDPMPNRHASVITDPCKLLGTAVAIRFSFVGVPLVHSACDAPDV
jgi:hypothetical protein